MYGHLGIHSRQTVECMTTPYVVGVRHTFRLTGHQRAVFVTKLNHHSDKMNTSQRYALTYLRAGLVPIPLRLDGSRKTTLQRWKPYQTERPSQEQVRDWFAQPAGIGIVLGIVSGGAECIDFDDPAPFGPIYDSLPTDLHKRLAVYETPKGFHVYYRCEEVFGGVHLAMRRDNSIRIETRGQGNMVTAEGSPFAVHKSGIPYCHYMGCRLESLASITPAERKRLWMLCASYDQTGEPTPAEKLGRQLAEREYRERHPVDPASTALASAYLAKMEPAIQGSNGSGACFRVACKLVGHFGLSEETALRLLQDEYNPRCNPMWSDKELQHKLADAMRKVGRL